MAWSKASIRGQGVFALALLVIACGNGDETSAGSAGSGSAGSGGATSSGGASAGTTASGGATSSGGASAGTTASGGATSSGGASAGTTSSGGASAGTTASGGASAGTTASGGATSSGGASAGTTASGGATSSGGTGGATGGTGGATGGAGGATGGTGGAGTGGSAGATPVVRILAIGDTGEGNTEQTAVGAQMSAKCGAVGGCDAVVVLGDNFYDNGVASTSDAQWATKFENPYLHPNLAGVPFYVTLGNHDYGLTSTGNRQAQIDYSSLPVGTGPGTRISDKWHMPSAYYDVRIGDVHFFAIDSQDYSATQINDMKARIQASSATWKIVYGHHPRYTSGEHGIFYDNAVLGAAGMFALIDGISCGTDMYLSGHDHDMEFIDRGQNGACPNTYYAISGAGSKTRSSSSLVPKVGKQLFYQESIEGFAYLEFEGRTWRWQFIDMNGVVLWSKTITK